MKKSYLFLTLIFALILCFVLGCSKETSEEGIAYISPNTDSEYVTTFKELGLGVLYDFNFKLTSANKSWVTVWVEGYSNGEKVEPHLTQLSYGLSPKEVEEGHLGFGIINPQNEDALFFLYAPGVGMEPHKIENSILHSDGGRTWDYAIGDEKVALESGETKLLGVYRQANSYRTYDAQDPDAVKRMIKEDEVVLLLKIKVEEKSESDLSR